jgi:hypothetical protein
VATSASPAAIDQAEGSCICAGGGLGARREINSVRAADVMDVASFVTGTAAVSGAAIGAA